MSIGKLFMKIFGENIFENVDAAKKGDDASQSATLSQQMVQVKSWLNDKLDKIEADCKEGVLQQQLDMQSRLGPDLVIFDMDYSSTVRIASDRLSLRSQGSFNTVRANVCVYGGRWMYEIHLHSKGVMQVGWCSNKCTFNENSGVGDSKFSYGYDGSKQQSWHISTATYGDKWQIGDIIGVTIDVDKEEIAFYRNGNNMGVAFKKLQKGPGISFFPAISLGFNQGIQANFGNGPFKYPIAGFLPLMAKPIIDLQKADVLLGYLMSLSSVVARYNCNKEKKHKSDDKMSTRKTVNVIFCNLLIDKLSPFLLNQYIIEDKLLSYIGDMCQLKNDTDLVQPGHPESVLGAMLNVLWNYFEVEEMKFILRKLANTLLSDFTHTHKNLSYDDCQRNALQVLVCLCNHTKTRKSLLEWKFFKKHYFLIILVDELGDLPLLQSCFRLYFYFSLALLMYVRPPEFSYMQELIPNHIVWTEGLGGPKNKYLQSVDKISKSTEFIYVLQKTLLLLLLNNNDGDNKTPSSRKIFLTKFRRYVMDLSIEQRPFHTFFFMQSSILHPIDNTVALAFICILIDVTKGLFEKEMPSGEVEIPPRFFYDGTFDYQHYDRIGGVLSHLRKVHHNDIVQQLGSERTQELLEDDRVVVRVAELAAETINSISLVGRQTGTTTTFTTFLNPRLTQAPEATSGNLDTQASLCEMLDLCVLYYYAVGHKYVVKIANVRDEIAALNDALNEARYYRENVKILPEDEQNSTSQDCSLLSNEIKTQFYQRENIFIKRSTDLARKQAWFRGVALNQKRRTLFAWLLDKTLKTLNIASIQGSLFSFVPEVYINILPILMDTIMDFSNHDLTTQFDISEFVCTVNLAADFLSVHSADPRIILASCKDSLLQALGTLTCHKTGIKSLERTSKKSQLSLVNALLRPYENRAWGQSNWLLLRFWLGEGFAYKDARQPSVWQGGTVPLNFGLCRSRAKNESHTGLLHNVAPPNPSHYFQKIIGEKLTVDEPFATTFLNSVLNQLNWAFSEFILLLQEIQNTALRQENTIFEPKQLKICSMCFELTVSLMRCLEMIISVAPDIFHDSSRPNSDLILNRVCQLISQVLSRVTVPPGCFQFVVDMCSADLNAVTHFPIITAALGILLALLRDEMNSDKNPSKVTRVTRALLTDPSFQFANLEFALGEIKTPILQQTDIPRGNFDPSTRPHIDPLTNDVRVPHPTSSKRIRADPPIIKFSLSDYPTHVTEAEIEDVRRLIDMLKSKQSLLSDITLPSEDSLCPICCAKPIEVVFTPCNHQSCSNCILQHLINSKVCFYCKSPIKTIEASDGTIIYQNNDYIQTPNIFGV